MNRDYCCALFKRSGNTETVGKRKQQTSSSKPSASKKAKAEPKEKKPSVAPTSSTSNHASSTHNHHKDSADVEGADEAEMDPETKRVKGWRHTLQRGFLPKDGHINASEMEQHDKTFKQVEAYNEITINQLRSTKIGKVMKRIIQLPSVPQDDVYHFQERAQKLCDRWSEVMGISGGGSASAPKKEGSASVSTPAPAPAKEDSSSTPAPVPASPKKEESTTAPKTDGSETQTNGNTKSETTTIANGSSEAIVQ